MHKLPRFSSSTSHIPVNFSMTETSRLKACIMTFSCFKIDWWLLWLPEPHYKPYILFFCWCLNSSQGRTCESRSFDEACHAFSVCLDHRRPVCWKSARLMVQVHFCFYRRWCILRWLIQAQQQHGCMGASRGAAGCGTQHVLIMPSGRVRLKVYVISYPSLLLYMRVRREGAESFVISRSTDSLAPFHIVVSIRHL